jgi:hypothetical protein
MNHKIYILGALMHVSASAIFTAEATNAEMSALLLARLAAQQNQPPLQAPVVPVPQNNLPAQPQAQSMGEILLARLAAQRAQNPAPVPIVPVPRINAPPQAPRVPALQIIAPPQAQTMSELLSARLAAQQAQNPAPVPVVPAHRHQPTTARDVLLNFAMFETQTYNFLAICRIYEARNDEHLYEILEPLYQASLIPEEDNRHHHQVHPAPQPDITERGQINAKLAEWRAFYSPTNEEWQQKGFKPAATLKNALFGCYENARQKQLDSAEQWHTNFSLLLRDPHMKNWVLPSYNGPSMAVEAVGWNHFNSLPTNHLWLNVRETAKTLVEPPLKDDIANWFKLLDSSRDSQINDTRGSLRGRVKTIVDFLKETKNSREQIDKNFFRKAVEILQDGQTACADRTVVSLDNLELAAALHRASKQNPASKVHTLLSVGLVQFKLALIEQNFIKREAEALQAALYYRINLADSLNLGINTKGSRYGNQLLDKLSLEQAIDATFKATTPIALAEFLAKWDPWKEHMAPAYEAEGEAVLEQYGNLYGDGRADEAHDLLANFEVTKLTKNTAAALDALKDPANGGYLTQNRYYAIPRELIDN